MDNGDNAHESPRQPLASVCAAPHPLLGDIHCQRLEGHPGRHGAWIDAPSADVTMEWEDEEKKAG